VVCEQHPAVQGVEQQREHVDEGHPVREGVVGQPVQRRREEPTSAPCGGRTRCSCASASSTRPPATGTHPSDRTWSVRASRPVVSTSSAMSSSCDRRRGGRWGRGREVPQRPRRVAGGFPGTATEEPQARPYSNPGVGGRTGSAGRTARFPRQGDRHTVGSVGCLG
jgi:hypothetical protein